MGFLSRMLVPRSVRRAAHPVRSVKRSVTPKPVRRATRALNPVSNATYGLERSIRSSGRATTRAAKPKAPVYRHGTCTVNHRSPEAAAKCRRTY
jgi:hypothetical protein